MILMRRNTVLYCYFCSLISRTFYHHNFTTTTTSAFALLSSTTTPLQRPLRNHLSPFSLATGRIINLALFADRTSYGGTPIASRNQFHFSKTPEVISNKYPNTAQQYRKHTMSSSQSSETATSEELTNVADNYRRVYTHVQQIADSIPDRKQDVRLVAVSKTKPIELLEAAYNAGCRHFGENYVQELIQKVEYWDTSSNKKDVQWHFIGALQSNKCQSIVNCFRNDISRLTIETISSVKLATKLNNAISSIDRKDDEEKHRLKVFVQVNTSGEDSKSGVEPNNPCMELCQYIINECPYLQLCGLMTIGAPGDASCFTTLVQCRTDVLNSLHDITTTTISELELSMGMSDDFEQAIRSGSTNVRVGSTIFGSRIYPTST